MAHFKGFLPVLAAALLLALLPAPATARTIIHDAEIEHTLRLYADPILDSAGLTPSAVKIFIIDDKSINAFVAGGSNIFIHTGLIMETKDPSMLIGVIAHETGHIAGGHLAKGSEKLRNAQMGSILSSIVGAAAAVGGAGQAGAAIMQAGQQVATRNLLSFSRANEQAADQAALTYLDDTHQTADGMLRMFELLRRNEGRQFAAPDPYTITHPLSKERIAHVRSHVESSSFTGNPPSQKLELAHARMLAKLYAFLQVPSYTLQKYPESDKSVAGRYARAIAYYRQPNLPKAIEMIDQLIKESPQDPFFHELKGQMLYENGHIAQAITSYEKAVSLLPDAPLIRADLGKAQLASEQESNIASAIKNLEIATQQNPDLPGAWHLLATAYGKANRLGPSYLALAEEALLNDDPEAALLQVDQAMKHLQNDAPARLRAQDLKQQAERLKEDKKKGFFSG